MEEAESELVSVDAASEDVLLSVEAVPSVVVPSAGVVEEASVPAGAGVVVRLAVGVTVGAGAVSYTHLTLPTKA